MREIDASERQLVEHAMTTALFDVTVISDEGYPTEEFEQYFRERLVSSAGSGTQATVGFYRWLLAQVLSGNTATPETGRALLAARYLLAVVDDDDSLLASRADELIVKSARLSRPQDGESYAQLLRRHKNFRHIFAANVSGYGTAHNTFESGRAPRTPVLEAVMSRLMPVFERHTSLAVHWRAYQKEQAGAGEIEHMPGVRGGWGPPRESWSHTLRPDHAAINTRHDHPALGSSLNFFRVQEVSEGRSVTRSRSRAVVEPGRTYRALVFISNDADPALDLPPASNVSVRVQAPARFVGAARLTAFIDADGVEVPTVWDSIVIALPDPKSAVALRLVKDSATLRSTADGKPHTPLDAGKLFRKGVPVGQQGRTDGILPAEQGSLTYLTFDFVVDKPGFEVTIQARPHGSGQEYRSHIEAEPDDVIDVRVQYRNTGTTQQNNVKIVWQPLPPALQFYDKRILFANAKTDGKWQGAEMDPGNPGGYNLGSFTPGSNCYVHFHLKVRSRHSFHYPKGLHWLETSKLVVIFTENGNKSAGLSTVVFANTRPIEGSRTVAQPEGELLDPADWIENN